MLASTHFGIARTASDDWFDPILNADTKLFLDPFLLFRETSGPWAKAHDNVVAHFDRAFHLVAEGNRDPSTLPYRKAVGILTFDEPEELCLGYTMRGTSGAGSGIVYARSIAAAIADAINRGLKHPRHFEELGILNEGIGPDRISDITCTILKSGLITYTQEIATRHNVSMAPHTVTSAAFDEQRQRWANVTVDLPTNPFTDGPLLFVPSRFLRDLPVLNADDWWDWYEGEKLRDDMNYDIMGRVNKASIVAAARENPELVREWTKHKEAEEAESYDFDLDPKGVWKWDASTAAFALAHPLVIQPASNSADFLGVISLVVGKFKLFVEEQGGWSLLWQTSKGPEKPEEAAQLLFRGIAQSYCAANNITVDREVELGRGTVDFKFSNGYTQRAHLEVKKLHNGKFWNGLEAQLPTYMKADEVMDGWLLALRYRSTKSAETRAAALPKRALALNKDKGLNIVVRLVDARPPIPASKL